MNSDAPSGPLATDGQTQRRSLIVSLVVNGVLFMLVCGLGLYAFMLKVDLDENKRRLAKEIESRRQLDSYLQETRNLLTRSLAEIEQLKAQLAYQPSDAQTAASGKPALPIVVTFRTSVLGKGLVAVIENTSEHTLTLVLSLRNPTLSSVRRFTLELNPKSSTDFGHLEGWQFASGDEVGLFNDAFGALRLTVP